MVSVRAPKLLPSMTLVLGHRPHPRDRLVTKGVGGMSLVWTKWTRFQRMPPLIAMSVPRHIGEGQSGWWRVLRRSEIQLPF